MANQIRLKRASGSDPGASDLVTGEVDCKKLTTVNYLLKKMMVMLLK